MMRVLLVDDEKPARDRLRRLLAPHEDLEIVGEADSGTSALERVQEFTPDLVFLDIQMSEIDGLGVAQALGKDGPAIIFATAYDQYALHAFDTAAIDYLVKPITAERLERALAKHRSKQDDTKVQLARVLQQLEGRRQSQRIALKSGSRYIVVDPTNIAAVVAEDHYAVVKGGIEEILCDDTLDAIQQRLPASTFLRIHRSAIINLDKVESLDREGDRKYFAIMSGRERLRLPISRERLAEVRKSLGIA